MQKKPRKKIDANAWMNTYSDMVTLLLCFFVLLFSMSTIDAQKWQILVRGFNPDAESSSQVVLTQEEEPEESTVAIDDGGDHLNNDEEGLTLSQGQETLSQDEIDNFQDLYEYLEQYIQENSLEEQIKLFKGEDYTYVMFTSNIFFDGDSSVLKREGRDILDVFSGAIERVSSMISKIQVLGHTNQADPDKPNNVETDRFLSSNRAVEVLVYLQEKNIIAPSSLESIGYGQHYPIGSFSDPEGRARNRRVELVIAEDDTANIDLESIYSDVKAAQQSGQIEDVIVDPDVS